MCGIFGLLNNNKYYSIDVIKNFWMKGSDRGPDNSTFVENKDYILGFHRLSINGLNEGSHQPIIINNIKLICNGEIYNYKELFKNLGLDNKTDSDCEIIIHLYEKYGIDYTLNMLDGVFAFILVDERDPNNVKIIVSRDPFGVRPLYIIKNNMIGFSSELKCLNFISDSTNNIKYFKPGKYATYKKKRNGDIYEFKECSVDKYYNYRFHNHNLNIAPTWSARLDDVKEVSNNILDELYNKLYNAVRKRVFNTDQPVACLLSGGLDSSLIAALSSKILKEKHGDNFKLDTYSIGLEGSVDLKNAKLVAEHIESNHHEVVISEDNFFSSIPDVIYNIESYDTTTVRASVGNYLIGKHIKNTSNNKVILNGDGADELMGGYLYFHKCEDPLEFDKECKRLLKDIHSFDVLRSDKSISSHGLEPRTPFLDRELVDYYLSINPILRCHKLHNKCEKYIIRESVIRNNKNLLPYNILFRRKEAFSDGVSSLDRSWYKIIEEKVEDSNDYWRTIPIQESYLTNEQKYYKIFVSYFGDRNSLIIPYYWMPKYTNVKDSSARQLDIY